MKYLEELHLICISNNATYIYFNMEKYTHTYFKTTICKLRGNTCYHWISWFISLLSALIGLEEKSFHTQLNPKFISLRITPITSISGYTELLNLRAMDNSEFSSSHYPPQRLIVTIKIKVKRISPLSLLPSCETYFCSFV